MGYFMPDSKIGHRYLLALVPVRQERGPFIEVAQSLFGSMTDGYLLNETNSLPHVTLCAFETQDGEKIKAVRETLQNLDQNSISISLTGLHLKRGLKPAYHYSIGLSVAREPQLIELHYILLSVLKYFELTPLNPSKDFYQPHLTLAGIAWKPELSLVLDSQIDKLLTLPLQKFRLTLAKSDAIGQYLETLFEF